MNEYEKIIKEKGLPGVGQTVRSQKYGTLWRIMERRFGAIDADPKSGDFRMVPCIYLMCWKVEAGGGPGVGRMMGFEYTLDDNTFALNWDSVKN